MNKVLISQFSRVRIDFEFAVQNYARSNVHFNHKQEWKKGNVYTNFYSEKDNANRPLFATLTNEDKEILAGIGDNSNQVFISSIDSIGYRENETLYRLVDTLDLSEKQVQVLVASSDPEHAVYRASFMEVGPGNGDYIISSGNQNNRIFKWISPSGGVKQGNYEPQEVVSLPNKKNMWNLGGTVNISDFEKVRVELAISSEDRNLFSDLDDDDNHGKAYLAEIKTSDRQLDIMEGYRWEGSVNLQFTDQNFVPVDRFRAIEFDRNWNYNSRADTLKNRDLIVEISNELVHDSRNRLRYMVSHRHRGAQVDGWQHEINLLKSWKSWQVNTNYFKLENRTSDQHAAWDRFRNEIQYNTLPVVPGYVYQIDRNQNKLASNDSVMSTLNNFREHTFFLKSQDTAATSFDINYIIREDKLPIEGKLITANRSNTLNAGAKTRFWKQELGLNFTYRENENLTGDSTLNLLEKNIKIDVQWTGELLNDHIDINLNFGSSNGQELRRAFTFIEVPQGQGTHAWRDLNEDGIQDLNEFFEAINPDERNFIKFFNPTDEYIIAFTNFLDGKINSRMPRQWKQKEGILRLFSRLSNSTLWRINTRTTDPGTSRFNPFDRSIENEQLLSLRENLKSTFFFNRGSRKFTMEGTVVKRKRKQLISQGFDTRQDMSWSWKSSLGWGTSYTSGLTMEFGEKGYTSDILLDGDYYLKGIKLSPETHWQPSTRLRLTGRYAYSNFSNELSEIEEYSTINEYSVTLRYIHGQKSNLNATFNFLDIEFEGVENSPAGYELLQALRPGQNFTLNLNWQRYIGKAILLNLTYNARKSEATNVVQFGRVQVSAIF
jgi:hypothetical protein